VSNVSKPRRPDPQKPRRLGFFDFLSKLIVGLSPNQRFVIALAIVSAIVLIVGSGPGRLVQTLLERLR